MARIITVYQYEKEKKFNGPVFHCERNKELISAFSLNKLIAEQIKGVYKKRRSIRMHRILKEILISLPEDCVIKDFDVMFNPDYEIDVISILVDARREKNFEVIWPGDYKDGKLIYSEEGYLDYKIFDLGNYDLTCVI